jgi:4-hydroxybenzoate polyprenyltransferase
MKTLVGFVKASHAAPTAAVTIVFTLVAWTLGWRGAPLLGVFVAVLVGQLSVGWSNDAFDAATDLQGDRTNKPTLAYGIRPRSLWIAAFSALALSCVLSWIVAGAIGGTFHVFALAMAWLYNTVLSRTRWSWLPYALAFGAVPAFLTYGFNDQPPQIWMVAIFAIIGVSAHIANALPDIASDQAAGLQGFVISLGPKKAAALCWVLLITGTLILAIVSSESSDWLPIILASTLACAGLYAWKSKSHKAMFSAIIVVVIIEVVVLLLSS